MRPESVAKYKRFPKVDLPDRQWPNNEIIEASILSLPKIET